MDMSLLGVYWHYRCLTLRAFADFVRDLLIIMRNVHKVFEDLEWVGDGKRKPVPIALDFSNFDELIYRYSWGKKKDMRGDRNPDGSPSWSAHSVMGYWMVFNTGRSSKEGGLTVNIHAGDPDGFIPNTVNITFPTPAYAEFPHREFFDYSFLLNFFIQLVRYTKPERGLFTSHQYGNLIYPDGPPESGWLTYFTNIQWEGPSAEFGMEKVDEIGSIITLGREHLFAKTNEAIARGIRLREILKERGVVGRI